MHEGQPSDCSSQTSYREMIVITGVIERNQSFIAFPHCVFVKISVKYKVVFYIDTGIIRFISSQQVPVTLIIVFFYYAICQSIWRVVYSWSMYSWSWMHPCFKGFQSSEQIVKQRVSTYNFAYSLNFCDYVVTKIN